MLLLAKVDSIVEKQGRKGDTLVTRGIGHVKMILVLSTKVVALHMLTPIIQVEIIGF